MGNSQQLVSEDEQIGSFDISAMKSSKKNKDRHKSDHKNDSKLKRNKNYYRMERRRKKCKDCRKFFE
jgi:hypothetical protein